MEVQLSPVHLQLARQAVVARGFQSLEDFVEDAIRRSEASRLRSLAYEYHTTDTGRLPPGPS